MNATQDLAVLLVEDLEGDAELESLALERAGYHVRVRRVHDGDGMALALREDHWDVVLCDHVLLHFDARAAVGLLGASGSDIPLIVVSGMVGEEAAAAAIRDGAADFVSKDHLSRLAGVVRTQLRDAELQAAHRRAEAQFRGAFDDAPFGSALIALGGGPNAGRVLRVNRALCDATGHAQDELLGALVQDLLHPDERISFESELNAVLEGRKRIYRTEARLLTAAGRESWVLFSVSYVPAPGRQDAVAHFVDIDGRKRVEEALQLAHSQALEASRMKSEFVVNMSHELRTPLNGVVGLAGLLADTRLTSAQGAYVAGIRSSGQALMGVIGGILDFSKIEAGTLTIEPADFEPAEVIGEVCALLAPAVAEKGLELVASVDAAVPDFAYADSGPIRQVLTNLAGNAVKFTDAGEIVIRLSLVRGNARHLRFDVTDAGPGIEAGARPFEPFWQADSSMTRHHGGTGLGLTIAQRMVELMGGRLRYERASAGGSHFWFTIPFEEAHSTQAAVADLVGVRVLVVDDDANRRVILERQLGSLGLRVTVVDGGEAALAELCSGDDHGDPYRIAAVDRLLSAVDGQALPAAIQLSSSRYATHVLLLTATSPSLATWAAETGADGNLSEPLARSRMGIEVARVLGLGRAVPAAHAPGGRGRLLLAEDDAINQLFAFDLLKRDGWEVEVAEDGAQAVDLATAGSYDAILMDCQMPKVVVVGDTVVVVVGVGVVVVVVVGTGGVGVNALMKAQITWGSAAVKVTSTSPRVGSELAPLQTMECGAQEPSGASSGPDSAIELPQVQ